MRASAPLTSSVIATSARAWISKSPKPLPPPARRKPSSSQGRSIGISRGTKPSGSQPSAISAVSFTLASVPVPSQIGRRGFMWRIDTSGLPTPVAPGPV
jgi:hypothetical protein